MAHDEVMALALRPRRFSEMFGQEKITAALTQQVSSKRIPNAWLFGGETGSGKTTLARILGQWLQCPHQTTVGDYCKVCGRLNTINEVNAAVLNGVEAIKDLAQGSNYAPAPPAIRRVYILDEAQRVTKQAQGALLKTIEDAPRTTKWILCTTEPMDILATLRGRCQCFQMQPLRTKAVDALVKYAVAKCKIARDPAPFIDLVSLRGVTSARLILNALESYASGLDPEMALQAVESNVDTLRICQALLRGEWGPIRSELEKAVASDARAIRGAVLGYFKSILLNKSPSADLKKVTAAIKELGALGYQDEATLLVLVAGALWRICKGF